MFLLVEYLKYYILNQVLAFLIEVESIFSITSFSGVQHSDSVFF